MSQYHTSYDPATKTWSGRPLPAVFHPNTNVGQILLNALANSPNKIGQISYNNGLQMTNGELRMNAIRVAQNLAKIGLESGDIVAIAAFNNHDLASVVFGLLSLAVTISPMDTGFKTGKSSISVYEME